MIRVALDRVPLLICSLGCVLCSDDTQLWSFEWVGTSPKSFRVALRCRAALAEPSVLLRAVGQRGLAPSTALDGAELTAKSLNYTASRKLFCVKTGEESEGQEGGPRGRRKGRERRQRIIHSIIRSQTDRTVRHKQRKFVEGRFVAHHGAMPGATAAHLTIRARGEEAAAATMWNVRHCPE